MSRLLDRLDRINRGPVTSMGFGAAVRPEPVPALALIASLSDEVNPAEVAANLAKMGADGAIVESARTKKSFKQIVSALDKVPWGARISELSETVASLHREQGCDFLAFGPEGALVDAIEDGDTAYVLCIQPDMDERQLRCIEYLPVDAVLLPRSCVEPPLTIQHLIMLGMVRNSFDKYLLLEVTDLPTSAELERLKDIGVDGLVVDVAAHGGEELEGLRDRILSIPKRQRSTPKRADAVLPSSTYSQPGSPTREDDDED